jgi:hypothetical protein
MAAVFALPTVLEELQGGLRNRLASAEPLPVVAGTRQAVPAALPCGPGPTSWPGAQSEGVSSAWLPATGLFWPFSSAWFASTPAWNGLRFSPTPEPRALTLMLQVLVAHELAGFLFDVAGHFVLKCAYLKPPRSNRVVGGE